MKRYFSVVALTGILIVGAAVRFIGLGTIPPGLVDDEADKAYDAYSLLLTGKDQWGKSWPLLAFKGFGDYRTPLYTYLTVPSVAFFGLTPLAVRLPSAVFGVLSVIAVYFLVLELFREFRRVGVLALFSAALLAISPWHIGMSRMAMEVTVSVFLVMTGMYVFLAGRRYVRLLPFAGVIFGLSVYAYPAHVVFVPIVVLLLAGTYWDFYIKKYLSLTVVTVAVFLCIALPITITSNAASAVRTRQVNLTNDPGIIDLLNEKRGACQKNVPAPVCRLVYNKYYVFFDKFIGNYIHHFSPNLLGIGGTPTQYSMLPERGLLYMVELPLLLLGIYTAFRSKNKAAIFMTLFLLAATLPDSVTSDGHYTRFFISIPAWPILISLGILRFFELRRGTFVVLGVAGLLYIVEVFSFGFEYATYFPYRYSAFSHYGYKELVSDIVAHKNAYDKIIVSSSVHDAKQYIFYLFYTKYDPESFQKETGVEKGLDRLGWVRVGRIGPVYFVADLPRIDTQTRIADRELFIGDPSEFPKQVYMPVQFVVKDKKGEVLFQAVDGADYIRCMRIKCADTNTQ